MPFSGILSSTAARKIQTELASVKLWWLSPSRMKGSYLASSPRQGFTHSFIADQLLCRADQKEKEELNGLKCTVVFTVRK